jgi:transcriptional regulator with XRE-family HTH domain
MAEQWWGYVQRHLDERGWTPTDLSKQAGINRSIIGRWREGAQPEVRTAKALARALGRPVLEVLVASGLLDPGDVGDVDITVLTVGEISDDELVAEVAERLRARLGPLRLVGEETLSEEVVDEDPPAREEPRQPSGCGRNAT